MDARAQLSQTFDNLTLGDLVEVVHEVKVGSRIWNTTTRGTVVKKERLRHGLHHRRSSDDQVFRDQVVLRKESGERTTLSLDEFTELKKI